MENLKTAKALGYRGQRVHDIQQPFLIVSRFGYVLGTNLYDHYGGFAVCAIAIAVVCALILPTLLLVPKRLTDTADGANVEFGSAA